MKYISLGMMGEYKDFGTSFVNYEGIEKQIRKNDELTEIDILVDDEDKESCKTAICYQLTDMITDIVKNKILKKVVDRSYKDIYLNEINNIYEHSLQIFSEKEVLIKDMIFTRLQEYLSTNDYININGFLRFRLKDFVDYVIEISDRGLEKYLVERDYKEFIQLLKYFVEIQEEKEDILKIHIEKEGIFKLYDKYNRPLENNYTKDIISLALRENMNYEDFLISALITICPREIWICDEMKNNTSKEIIDTIEAIFDNKVKVDYES
ncbi:putative sporulation protein YtxC [Alkalithermobacter paradoxus]|uniref:YtxC-like family protein n=1 Tax=Alkalithermobacter paradoxus TaxID=29349 RepID=A0A1V4I894_9FIRM|nr:YtxC-like family protein [[Clostridium] thermoalcaliphilum]